MTMRRIYKCIPSTGRKNDSFIGIKFEDNQVKVYYPESLDLCEDINLRRRQILALLKSISLAKSLGGDSNGTIVNNNVGESYVLEAYIWILNDYLSNGIYRNIEKKIRLNEKGHINWKKTLNLSPIVSDGNIIYKDYYVDVFKSQDGILAEIYKYCVRISVNAIGWLLGIQTEESESIPYNKNIYISAIKSELDETFDDIKRQRLSKMLSIVDNSSSECNYKENFIYGVNDYFYVYERMIDSLYGNIRDIKRFYPSGEWHLDCFPTSFDSSNLRPDTIIENDETTYVLDAKYYRFGFTMEKRDLPNTSSIQKQITYGEFISTRFEKKNIINAFIIPYNKNKNKFGYCNDIEYVGKATAKWKNMSVGYGYIYTILIDMNFLLMNWNVKNKMYCSELMKLLDKVKVM